MNETQTALTKKLEEPAGLSKKYQMVRDGLLAVAIIFVATAIAIIFGFDVKDLAKHAMTVIGALVALFVPAQAANDWKTTDALSKQTSVT